jgi:predicted glycogen debranching enzyme
MKSSAGFIGFGRELCGQPTIATGREWLVTNGIGGYASGTVSGALTRRYHGLLFAALQPPLGRTLLLTKLDETVHYDDIPYALYTNHWQNDVIDPQGYLNIEHFALEGTIPTWQFAIADALLQKQIWMHQGQNITYVQYTLQRSTLPLKLALKALVNYRDYHGNTTANGWQMKSEPVEHGLRIIAFPGAIPFYILSARHADGVQSPWLTPAHTWNFGFDLPLERERGLSDREDHLHIATWETILKPGETITFIASTEPKPELNGAIALQARRHYEQQLLQQWQTAQPDLADTTPDWIQQLVLAADQFIVDRPLPNQPTGKTIIAGYHWFGDWGRDTMISLPGLTLTTGHLEAARSVLITFAKYVDQGMLPNRFPDAGEVPEYNTVDATLWYFEAIRLYYKATQDKTLLQNLFPVLLDILEWHRRGTRYQIQVDPVDGLLYAGQAGVQLTWMDAKVGDWVVTPRIGKPVEINALWYNALRTMAQFATHLGQSAREYETIASTILSSFQRFWNAEKGCCYDVIDGPDGNSADLRPNQLFAVSLPESPLEPLQQRSIVDICGRQLLTSYGLRSLSLDHPNYQGQYGGDQVQRDGAYHQGTVWGWLLGPFVLAHLRVYGDRTQARKFLSPMADHLVNYGVGSLSEIFEGDAPMNPCGCIAQAWTVAEVLRAWTDTR